MTHDLAVSPYDRIETASRDEIAALQLSRLRATLQYAYDNVPHHRAAFDASGVHPCDCRTLEDLARFPFTTKQDLHGNYPYGMFAVPREQLVRLHASAGTTGRPAVVGYTRRDVDTWADLVARSMHAAGARPGMAVHISYGYGLSTGGLGAHQGAERLGCTVIPVSGGQTARQARIIQDFQPDVIMVTPSYLLSIADELAAQGFDPAKASLRVGILGAEPWTEEMRAEIESTYAMDAVDLYGLSEVIGPGVAGECVEAKDGPTIWEDHFYPEVVDPIDGTPVPEGQIGELVLTSLTKQAMPVVRYRTRDLTRLLPGTTRTMRRMEKITGRSDDMMIVRGVNVFPTQIEEQILRMPGLSPHFQCVLARPGRLDELTVRVECREGMRRTARRSADAWAASAELAQELGRRIKELVGVTVNVDIVPPYALERSLGRARRIVDDRVRRADRDLPNSRPVPSGEQSRA